MGIENIDILKSNESAGLDNKRKRTMKTANEIAAELEAEAKRLQELAKILRTNKPQSLSEQITFEKEEKQ